MVMEDEQIIELYFKRDGRAISETSEKYGNYCNSIALNILKNREDAEECVNDTYMRVWNAIPPVRPTVFRVFIGRITRNLSFNLYKKMNTEKRGNGQVAVVLDELAECVSGGSDPSEEFNRAEVLKAINAFLADLPQDKRIMFVCRYWYSDSVTDIAKRCDVSENTVSVSLNRLRKKLRGYLAERGVES